MGIQQPPHHQGTSPPLISSVRFWVLLRILPSHVKVLVHGLVQWKMAIKWSWIFIWPQFQDQQHYPPFAAWGGSFHCDGPGPLEVKCVLIILAKLWTDHHYFHWIIFVIKIISYFFHGSFQTAASYANLNMVSLRDDRLPSASYCLPLTFSVLMWWWSCLFIQPHMWWEATSSVCLIPNKPSYHSIVLLIIIYSLLIMKIV